MFCEIKFEFCILILDAVQKIGLFVIKKKCYMQLLLYAVIIICPLLWGIFRAKMEK